MKYFQNPCNGASIFLMALGFLCTSCEGSKLDKMLKEGQQQVEDPYTYREDPNDEWKIVDYPVEMLECRVYSTCADAKIVRTNTKKDIYHKGGLLILKRKMVNGTYHYKLFREKDNIHMFTSFPDDYVGVDVIMNDKYSVRIANEGADLWENPNDWSMRDVYMYPYKALVYYQNGNKLYYAYYISEI